MRRQGANSDAFRFSDLFKAFDEIECCHKSEVFSPKRPIFLHACATRSELLLNIRTMPRIV